MSRKPRNANRGTLQNIEDEFCDLDTTAQARMLETLAGLHRQAQRMQRKKEPETLTLMANYSLTPILPEEPAL